MSRCITTLCRSKKTVSGLAAVKKLALLLNLVGVAIFLDAVASEVTAYGGTRPIHIYFLLLLVLTLGAYLTSTSRRIRKIAKWSNLLTIVLCVLVGGLFAVIAYRSAEDGSGVDGTLQFLGGLFAIALPVFVLKFVQLREPKLHEWSTDESR